MAKDEAKLIPIEEHLLWCGPCLDRAEEIQSFVDAVPFTRMWHQVKPPTITTTTKWSILNLNYHLWLAQ
jgi:hypothetical protein